MLCRCSIPSGNKAMSAVPCPARRSARSERRAARGAARGVPALHRAGKGREEAAGDSHARGGGRHAVAAAEPRDAWVSTFPATGATTLGSVPSGSIEHTPEERPRRPRWRRAVGGTKRGTKRTRSRSSSFSSGMSSACWIPKATQARREGLPAAGPARHDDVDLGGGPRHGRAVGRPTARGTATAGVAG
mgnify:CR=1 FL=1